MLVRKFEAKTMNEALKMIKVQLGPEAIILSARDNNKRFGIGGESSVEITAAIAEETYKRKMMAESRLTDRGKEQFQNTTAKYPKILHYKGDGLPTKKAKLRPHELKTLYRYPRRRRFS